jgi:hypothetical protein
MDAPNEGLDIRSCPILELWRDDVETLETQLELLVSEERLCAGTGEEVIAEHGFRGDFNAVVNQMRNLLEMIKAKPYTESDRMQVLQRYERYATYMNNRKEAYEEAISECVKKHTIDGLMEASRYAESYHQLKDTLHNKKECICFTNW